MMNSNECFCYYAIDWKELKVVPLDRFTGMPDVNLGNPFCFETREELMKFIKENKNCIVNPNPPEEV